MTAAGVSEHELEQLLPQDVAAYLRSRGWTEGDRVRYSRRWEREWGGRQRRVLLPLERDLADYADRMADLITALAALEDRSPNAVHQDLTLAGLDVQYIKTMPRTPSGTIPVQAGVLAVTSARDLLMAAACAAIAPEPRLVHPSRKPRAAHALVDTARFGPTTAGSYILSMQLPLPEPIWQWSLFDDPGEEPEPFARQVSRRMYEAVSAAREAAEAVVREDALALDGSVEQGVSADLCEALAGIGGHDGRKSATPHAFALDFAWSPRWPVPYTSSRAEFSPGLVHVLREVAQDLRRQEPERGVTVMGRSTVLKRADPSGPGEVTIEAFVSGGAASDQRRLIHVQLEDVDYTQAAAVHGQGRILRIEGDLDRRGTYHELINVTAFDVL